MTEQQLCDLYSSTGNKWSVCNAIAENVKEYLSYELLMDWKNRQLYPRTKFNGYNSYRDGDFMLDIYQYGYQYQKQIKKVACLMWNVLDQLTGGNRNEYMKQKEKDEFVTALQPGKTVAVFDTETTGLGCDDKIIQFSAIIYKVEQDYSITELDRKDIYINPGCKLAPIITSLTGITDEMLSDKADEFETGAQIYDFMAKADLWAAYNAGFDIRMLEGMSNRTNILFQKREVVDILDLARFAIPKSEVENYKLISVTQYLFADDDTQFHSAIEDVKATAKVMEKLMKKIRSI